MSQTKWTCCFSILLFLVVGGVGCVGTAIADEAGISEQTSERTSAIRVPAQYDLNQVVLGRSTSNVLKGMMLAADPSGGRVFVSGIMTDTVGIVDLASGKLLDSYMLAKGAQSVKHMVYDSIHKKLWVISNSQKPTIWISDPDQEDLLLSKDISSAFGRINKNYPVQSIALDPKRERLYVLATVRRKHEVFIFDSSGNKVGQILTDQNVWTLRWDTKQDVLVALTAPRNSQGNILVLSQGQEDSKRSLNVPSSNGLPPNLLTVDGEGHFYIAGKKNLWKLDGVSGKELWRTSLPFSSSAIEVTSSEVAILHKYSTGEATNYLSKVSSWDTTTGQAIATRAARYEASRMISVDDTIVVGNSGDASLTLFYSGTNTGVTVKVGTAAEDVLLTPDGKRVLVLNRLGGSQLIEFRLETGESRLIDTASLKAPWPVRMFLNATRDHLYILSHFESKLVVLSLSDLKYIGDISFGLPNSTSDTLSAMAADISGTLLVALLCEQGRVVIHDTVKGKTLAKVSLAQPALDEGPGRMNAAVDSSDPNNRKVYIYLKDNRTLYRLEEKTGFTDLSQSKVIRIDRAIQMSYGFRTLYFSPGLGKLFVWNQQVNPDTLKTEKIAVDVHRVVGEQGPWLLAQRKERGTVGQREMLIIVDAQDLTTQEKRLLLRTTGMDSKIAFDFSRDFFAVTSPTSSQLHLQELNLPTR